MPRLVQGKAVTAQEAPALVQELLDARKTAVDLFASIETEGQSIVAPGLCSLHFHFFATSGSLFSVYRTYAALLLLLSAFCSPLKTKALHHSLKVY